MSKIILDVDDKNKEVVLLILKNLKAGLINNITSDLAKPVSSSLNNKYKAKVQEKKVLEDDFIDNKTSFSKYSKTAYKQRLTKTIKDK